VPAADYKGDAKKAVWLPNAAVAKAWMEYVKTGTVSDSTPPPAPFNVKATAKGDQGAEIVWEAEADLESGIDGFHRDARWEGTGNAVSQDAKRWSIWPASFPGLSFHDTPEDPQRPMQYVDSTARPGTKHVYAVVELNSAGIPSKPSAPASIE